MLLLLAKTLMRFRGFTPCRSTCKVSYINILTMGFANRKLFDFFLKLKKIKFIISNMFHLVWKLFFWFENLKKKKSTHWNITTSQLWCNCEHVSKYVSHFIVFFYISESSLIIFTIQVHKSLPLKKIQYEHIPYLPVYECEVRCTNWFYILMVLHFNIR